MSYLNIEGLEGIKRSVSYNDLRKKRMGKSKINSLKMTLIEQQKKDKIQLCLQRCQTKNKNNIKLESISVMSKTKNNQQCQKQKQKENKKVINILHLPNEEFKQMELKRNESQRMDEKDKIIQKTLYKKTKSMRILTKKHTVNCLKPKNCQQAIRPIEGDFKKRESLGNDQFLKKYKTVPNQLKQEQPNLAIKQRDDIFFNAISPIHRKCQKSTLAKPQDVSGFSVLEDIKLQQSVNDFYVEEDSHKQRQTGLHLCLTKQSGTQFSQNQLKMPKIVKRHLPKDFFLRV